LILNYFNFPSAIVACVVAGALPTWVRADGGDLPAPLAERLVDTAQGGPQYDGSGCPWGKGGVAISLTPDGRTLSVLFDDFHAAVSATIKPPLLPKPGPGPGPGREVVDQKFCEIRVPVQIPAGYSLQVFRADYRGFAYIVGKTEGRLTSTVKIGSLKKPVRAEHVLPSSDEPTDYLFTHELPAGKDNRLECAEARPRELVIRFDLSLRSRNTAGQQAMLTLDSIDGGSFATRKGKGEGVHYGLDWRPCKPKGPKL
jgi:hypothetical protein